MKQNVKVALVGLSGVALILTVVGLAFAATNTPGEVSNFENWDSKPKVSNGAVTFYAPGSLNTTVPNQPTGWYTFGVSVRTYLTFAGNLVAPVRIAAASFADYGVRVEMSMDPVPNAIHVGTADRPAIQGFGYANIGLRINVGLDASRATAQVPLDASLAVQLYGPYLAYSQTDPGGVDPGYGDNPPVEPPVPEAPPADGTIPGATPTPTEVPPPPDKPGIPGEQPGEVALSLYLKVLPSRLIVDDSLAAGGGGLYGDGPSAEVIAVALNNLGKVDTHGQMTVKLADQDAGFGQLVAAPVDISQGDPQYLGLYVPPAQAAFKSRMVHLEAIYEVPGQEPLHAEAVIEVIRIATVADKVDVLTVKAGARNLYMIQVNTR